MKINPASGSLLDAREQCGFRELLNSRLDKIPQLRHELRNILKDQIVMTPTGDEKKRHYVATVTGRPLHILADLPGVSHVLSATGTRTPVRWLRTTRPNP